MNVLDSLLKLVPFSAPAATIIAAIYVSKITKKLSERQSEIARQQAITADRKLKLDLFDKRFSVYMAAMRAAEIALVNENPAGPGYDKWPEFRSSIIKSLDGRFLFKNETYLKLKQLVDQSDTYLTLVYNYHKKGMIDTNTLRQETDDMNAANSRLLKIYREFPDDCAEEMHLDF